ncbi:hypothetical protein ACFPYJ_19505 [Paenibacillus solisilvae]|uniref:Uncharacterized protein n=1 Tax=Paenibacillus solisilvae TaxID=2486751 RepID=A0ABW0VZB4_9BACL
MDADIAKVIPEFDLQGIGQMLTGVLLWAIDPGFAERLLKLSEELTGVKFKA